MEDFDSFSKLKEGLSLKKLFEKGSDTFTIESENLWGETEAEKQVETFYEFEDVQKHINMDCIQNGPDDVNSAGTPFDEISANMTDVTPDGKVKKQILRSGSSKIVEGSVVYLHYNKYVEHQEVPFDSTYLRNKDPIRLQLGRCATYPGLEIALSSMCVGEKSQFLIHYTLAFGELGAPPRVPPKATILAVIEVFKAVDCGSIREEESLSLAARKEFKTAYTLAKQAHERANDYFASRNVLGAVEYYRRAENLLLNCSLNNDEEETKMKYLLLKIYVNMTVCYNTDRLKQPERVCIAAKRALELDQKNAMKSAKLFYNRGLANQALGNYKLASKDFNQALKLEPTNDAINNAIKTLDHKRKAYHDIEKGVCQKMFGFSIKDETEKLNFDEVHEDCRKAVTDILEEFAEGSTASLQLGSGFTFGERSWIKHETDRLGLVYEASGIIDGKRNIYVKKKFH